MATIYGCTRIHLIYVCLHSSVVANLYCISAETKTVLLSHANCVQLNIQVIILNNNFKNTLTLFL